MIEQTRKALSHPVTMGEIIQRCKEDGDCMVWKFSMSFDGRPLWHVSKRRQIPVRRLVLEIKTGLPIPKGRYACCTCETEGCVTHAAAMTRSQRAALAKKQGRIGGPAVAARNRAAGRKGAKLNEQAAHEIRQLRGEGWTLVALGKKYGVHHSAIQRICLGKSWMPLVRGASVFAYAP